jgi:hypothetical protein
MNLSSLQTLTLSWLDDMNAGYFTLPQVTAWLNNAQRETQKQLIQAGENWYVQKSAASTIASQDSYSLPSDYLKCHKLEVVLSGSGVSEQRRTLTPVTLIQIDNITSLGIPEIYCLKKNCIIMRPIPDSAYVLYLHYSYLVTDMANALDVPDVPEQYHEYLAVLATIDGFMKDRRDPSAFIVGKRDSYLALMKQDSKNRTVDAPRSIVMTDGEDFGGFSF